MGICVTCYTTSCSYNAWLSWNDEFNTMLNYMGCPYYYNIMQVSGEALVAKEQKNKKQNTRRHFLAFFLIFIIVQSVSKMITDGQNIANTEQKKHCQTKIF